MAAGLLIRRAARAAPLLALGLLGVWSLALYLVPPQRYRLEFQLQNFDYGILYHASARIAAGRDGFMTVRGVEILADNQEYLLWLLAPLHWLPRTPELLLGVHSLALWSCGAIVAGLLWRRSPWAAALAAGFAWSSPFLLNMSLDLAHVEAFAAPLLLLVYGCWSAGRWRAALLALGLALACKEDVAISAGALLALLAWRPPGPPAPGRRAALAGVLACGLLLAVNLTLVLPQAKRATCARLDPDAPPSAVAGFSEPVSPFFQGVAAGLPDPAFWAERLGRQEVWVYFARLLWPAPIVLAAAPAWALLPLPAALLNAVSGTRYLVEGHWHYDHSSFALLLIGLVHALRRMPRPVPAAVLLAAGAVAVLALGQPPPRTAPGAPLRAGFWRLEKDERVAVAEALAAALPRDAVTSADYTTLNYLLDGRWQLYMFPNPLASEAFGIAGVCSEWARPPRPELVLVREDYALAAPMAARLDAGWERWSVTGRRGEARFRVWLDPGSPRAAALRRALHNLELGLAVTRRESAPRAVAGGE